MRQFRVVWPDGTRTAWVAKRLPKSLEWFTRRIADCLDNGSLTTQERNNYVLGFYYGILAGFGEDVAETVVETFGLEDLGIVNLGED